MLLHGGRYCNRELTQIFERGPLLWAMESHIQSLLAQALGFEMPINSFKPKGILSYSDNNVENE